MAGVVAAVAAVVVGSCTTTTVTLSEVGAVAESWRRASCRRSLTAERRASKAWGPGSAAPRSSRKSTTCVPPWVCWETAITEKPTLSCMYVYVCGQEVHVAVVVAGR